MTESPTRGHTCLTLRNGLVSQVVGGLPFRFWVNGMALLYILPPNVAHAEEYQ